MDISICLPTHNRPDKAVSTILNVLDTTKGHDVEIVVVANPCPGNLERLMSLEKNYKNVILHFQDCNAITGWNVAAGIASEKTWMMLHADDFYCKSGWLDAAERTWINAGSPEICYLGFPDKNPNVPNSLFTIPMGTRRFFIEHCGGCLAIPVFKSWYGDNWTFDVAKRAGCNLFCPEPLVEHQHPAWGFPSDKTYENSSRWHQEDYWTYQTEKNSGYPIRWNAVLK